MGARNQVKATFEADQVVAILRDAGRPLNASEVARSLPFMDTMNGHVQARGHSTADHASRVLRRLSTRGIVVFSKLDRRVLWSLAPAYLAASRETATLAAVALARAGLPAVPEADVEAARASDCLSLSPEVLLREDRITDLPALTAAFAAVGVQVIPIADFDYTVAYVKDLQVLLVADDLESQQYEQVANEYMGAVLDGRGEASR